MSNLRLINETSVISNVSTVSMTDVFSADFDVYQVIIKKMTASADDTMRFTYINSSGSELTSSYYDYAQQVFYSTFAFQEEKNTNQSSSIIGGYGIQTDDEGMGTVMTIFNPFTSSYTFHTLQIGYKAGTSQTEVGRKGIGVYKGTDSITGIKFKFNASGEYEKFSVAVYGLRVDS